MHVTRCKLVCSNIEENQYGEGFWADFHAVYDSNPESENGRFFHATPCAQVRLGILNPAVRANYKVGQEYYVDFIPINPPTHWLEEAAQEG